VQTAELDGERNLKPKMAPKFVQENYYKIVAVGSDYEIKVETTPPTKDLYKFKGKLNDETPLDIN
jgi:hypothetical protein